MTKDSASKYTRTIRLAPALGDWTRLSPDTGSQVPIKIQSVQTSRFDSLRKEAFQTAHLIHYRLGEAMCHKLSKDMDIKIELHSVSATQMPYAHFIKSMGDQLIQADLVAPTGDRINVILDWPLAEQMIDRLTGGSGLSSSSDEFSAIEAGILETQMEEIIDLLPSVWKHSWEFKNLAFEFNAGTYLSNKKVSDRDAVVVFEYQLLLGQGELREICITYPNLLLRKMLESYNIATQYITPTIALNESTMQRVKIPAKVVLGDAQIAMNELRSLQVGDILRLESSITNPLKLVFADDTELTVQPGTIDEQFCAQVLLWDTSAADSKKRAPVNHPQQSHSTAAVTPPSSIPTSSIPAVAAAVATTAIIADTPQPTIASEPAIDDLFGADFDVATLPDDQDDHDTIGTHSFEDDEDDDLSLDAHADEDDDFGSDDIFSEDYGLDETPSATPSEPETTADDDDDFSWDDLEDEL